MSRHRVAATLAALAGAALAALLSTSPARAQYFGRNKVLYRTFDFRVLKTEHFDVYYYPEEATVAAQAARMAERWYARLSQVFGHDLSNRQPIILYASYTHFAQTNAIPGEIEEGLGGVTESLKRRVVLPVGGSLAETDHVIGHELTHAFQYDITGHSRGSAAPAVGRLPLWFVEGMAEYMSIGPIDPHTAMWMRDAAYFNRLPTVTKLNDPRFFPYRYGHALWAYIGQRWGDGAVGEVMRVAARSGDVNAAFLATLGMDSDSLSREWHRSLRELASRVPRRDPDHEGRTLVGPSHAEIGRYNVAPALSPDGRRLMFLSERDLYTMELYLADANTGRIIRKVTKSALDPHLQSLEFVAGSGAWSPDSRAFAFATVREGRPAITVIDVATGRTKRQYHPAQVDEVLTLSWSPDGSTIAFSGLAGGQSDLFALTLATGASKRLTNDLYADLQPAWSPDGRTIVFSTERFSTSVDSLEIGSLELATVSLGDGRVQRLPAFDGAKHVNPQWSPDGRSIYAVVDRGGISNVYRLDLESGRWERVTSVSSGVSGVTAYSPAFSVARHADRMVFAGYQHGTYNLYAVDSLSARAEPLGPGSFPGAARLVPEEVPQSPLLSTAHGDSAEASGVLALTGGRGAFPPAVAGVIRDSSVTAARAPSVAEAPRLLSLLKNPSYGRQDTVAFRRARYRPTLSLDRVSQVELGIGTTGSGIAGAGGAALFWSDMLGDHNLGTYLEVSSDGGDVARSTEAVLDYTNLHSRVNWGMELSQIPRITRQITTDVVPLPNGDVELRQQDAWFWQVERGALATLAFPFSRSDRGELGAGYQSIDFSGRVETQVVSSQGVLLSDDTQDLDFGVPRIDLAVADVAYVHDISFFGGTSPIAGSRWRVQVEPVLGDLQYHGVLADWRSYFMPVRPWTIAVRGMHYGRYGHDGETDLLTPLFLGYPSLVRGYDDGSFTLAESAEYERLFGSRLAVGNVELRVPLVGALGLFPTPSVPPVELAPFFDAGSAWSSSDRAQFLGGDRKTVTSAGLATRINLFGFLIAEADYVHPNDRPRKGWYWQFSVQPGF